LPLMMLEGCSSPSRMSTRFGSLSSVTHEVRACSEYWIDWPWSARHCSGHEEAISRLRLH
jgi:hypothetical protein